MRRLVVALAASVALSTAIRAQSAPAFTTYCDALRLFSANRADAAIVTMDALPLDGLRKAVPLTGRCVGTTKAAATVAITYTAVALSDGPIDRVADYLVVAESLLRNVTVDDLRAVDRSAVAAFQEDWFVVASSLMLAWTDPSRATRFSDRGLALFKNSVRLHTLSGMATELRAHLMNANLHDPLVVAGMPRNPIQTLLVAAEGQYRQALAVDRHAVAARVHLGRVLYLRKEIDQARETLAMAAADATAPAEWRYLAHLFAGAAAEFEHDLPRARLAYEAALKTMPEMQTAFIALSVVEQRAGNEARARQLIADAADAPRPTHNDPWSDYDNGGFEMATLAALRARVLR